MDNNFKPDAKSPKSIETKKEYSFDEGVEESVKRIQKLLKKLKRNVFVAINGSAVDVGKTFFLGALQKELTIRGIEVEHTPSFDVGGDKTQKVIFNTEQGKIYLSGRNYRDDIKEMNPGLGIGKIADLYIGIYRPDKSFSGEDEGKESPVADIMIRNEFAKDKRR
jgi:hypothetical protein